MSHSSTLTASWKFRVMAAQHVDSFSSLYNWSWRKAKQRGV
jgi:hypothetical protein